MSATTAFLHAARRRYADANAATLRWMLARPPLLGGFLNTKVNSLTGADYTPADGLRGPGWVYGWIQGRGLEALAAHARFFEREDPALALTIDAAGRQLHREFGHLVAAHGARFLYDDRLRPVCPGGEGVRPQSAEAGISTYSRIFAAKGLAAAALRYGDGNLPRCLSALESVAEAIAQDRFQMDEQTDLSAAVAAGGDRHYGPRMILLGAARLMAEAGHRPAFADRFIAHVLEQHLDARSGLLRDVVGGDAVNPGHAIEFVGFALEHLGPDGPPDLVRRLRAILSASFAAGFRRPGIALSVSAATGAARGPHQPWWSLPETIRAAALAYDGSGDAAMLAIWQAADAAFFQHYWRGAYAVQTLTADGPADYVPATPDLDPGYHTGLSLLAAIGVADRLADRPATAARRAH